MSGKSHANGNSAAIGQGAVAAGSPLPPFMRGPDWLLLQETKTHQLLMP